tara:strand:- start:882 stop:1520 length:639 start_codon:yes stop_codon:yes gene_type:complete
MSFISIISQFLYYRTIPEHEEIKKQLMPKILEQEEKFKNNNIGLENAYTSYSNELNDGFDRRFLVEQSVLKPIVLQTIDEVIRHMISNNIVPIPPYKEYFVSNAWYTRYNTGGNFDYHSHGHSQTIINGQLAHTAFSIIYILNDQNVGNSTMFINHDRKYLSTNDITEIDTAGIHDIKEGTVIIFPSNFLHKVKPIKIPNRITVSYNIVGVL